MSKSTLLETLKELYITENPNEAAKGRNGEVQTKGKQKAPPTDTEGMIPLIALGLGAGVLMIAFLKPQGSGGVLQGVRINHPPNQPINPPQQEQESEEESDGNWGILSPDW